MTVTRLHLRTIVAGLVLLALAVANSTVIVRSGELVVITRDRMPAGNAVAPAGLHFRLPLVQNVFRLQVPEGEPSFDNSLVLAPLYPDYVTASDAEFAEQTSELKRRLGSGRHVLLGFSTGVQIAFHDLPMTLSTIDSIVQRAKVNGIVAHISLASGLFHGWGEFREQAIRDDVRNAQWFADGLIAPPEDLKDPSVIPHSIWITPSRYATPLRTSVEAAIRRVGAHLAQTMERFPETLMTVSGDGEVEYSYERSFSEGAEGATTKDLVYTDYSPFMVAEFRDTMRALYASDASPASDGDADGRVFNRDFGTDFESWSLKYYDRSVPLPYSEYVGLESKLPQSGPNFVPRGFDAPREVRDDDPFWKAWVRFRQDVIANWVRDFAKWIRTPEPGSGFTIPPSRYYTHQIPAEFLFGRPNNLRLKTSASVLATAFIDPDGSSGITAFNTFNGWRYGKTTSSTLFSLLARSSDHWGILEYNPSVPSSNDDGYYFNELRHLYSYRPHLIVPFAWSDSAGMQRCRIQDSSFERSLRRFISEAGNMPWFSVRKSPPPL